MKTALIQLNSSDNPAANLIAILAYLSEAVRGGASFCLTPEVSNCVSTSRAHQQKMLTHEDDDLTLKAIRDFAATNGVWVLIGSLAVKTHDADGRFANRSFLIDPTGGVVAKYDKIHMFDVQVSAEETYRESAGYRPGSVSVLAQTPFATIGMSICYDVRFPHLFRDLAQAGAEILTIPAAFSPATGKDHWEPLLRARAIETGCFILAPAQTGRHAATGGNARSTYGHSMAIDPWGKVLLDAGTDVGVHFVDLDLQTVAQARSKVPSLTHDRDYTRPKGSE